MHELGLLTGVATAAKQAAGDRPILRVALRVGTRAGVVEEALYAAWDIVGEGELNVEMVPASVYCPSCACEQEIDEFFALTCPVCGTPTADLRHGREFEISFVDLANDP
ncbi:hydrogenase maturation nickel metallochaperone HypA [Corynebacterium sp.]|uniref:hydrogenase maturation nickel metallochaperone HypA/HybF n=1 Tax=Corynebacterium sp. TaxID=1720 RepID=UPI0026DA8275|nr:hydrogenase maturation nickel metallochaperone HypA [Corynebacterium sp.]MDO5077219.1 hydrogenase maturation nickel metallochaperone HypA [Corynebacterium sp.]